MDAISFIAGWAVGIATLLIGYYVRKPNAAPRQEDKKTEIDRQWDRLMDYHGEEQGGLYADED